MELMLATKRKRDAEGKATQFTFHGHVVGEKKLQRSSKRLNVSSTSWGGKQHVRSCCIDTECSSDMPSYIQAFSPRSSNRSPRLSQGTPTADFEISNNDVIPAFLSYENAPCSSPFQRSSLPADPQTGFVLDPNDVPSRVPQHQTAEESWRSVPVPIKPGGIMSLHNAADQPDLFTLTTNSNDFNEDLAENLLSNDIDCMVDAAQCLLLPEDSRATLAAPLSDSMFAIPLSTPVAPREPVGGFDSGQSPSTHSLWKVATPNKVVFYGSNPENVISPLQMIRAEIQRFQDKRFQLLKPCMFGSQTTKLIDEMKGNTLISGVEDAVLWAYEASADFLKQKKAPHRLGYHNALPLYESMEQFAGHDRTSDQIESELINTDCSRAKSARIGYVDMLRPTGTPGRGTLRIEFWERQKEAFDRGNGTPYHISIFAIPEVRDRSESGVHLSFLGQPQNLPLYTIIKTYNVVPDNSEIIEAVRWNDTRAFRKLIKERKASPRDVDSQGFSLLHVSSDFSSKYLGVVC